MKSLTVLSLVFFLCLQSLLGQSFASGMNDTGFLQAQCIPESTAPEFCYPREFRKISNSQGICVVPNTGTFSVPGNKTYLPPFCRKHAPRSLVMESSGVPYQAGKVITNASLENTILVEAEDTNFLKGPTGTVYAQKVLLDSNVDVLDYGILSSLQYLSWPPGASGSSVHKTEMYALPDIYLKNHYWFSSSDRYLDYVSPQELQGFGGSDSNVHVWEKTYSNALVHGRSATEEIGPLSVFTLRRKDYHPGWHPTLLPAFLKVFPFNIKVHEMLNNTRLEFWTPRDPYYYGRVWGVTGLDKNTIFNSPFLTYDFSSSAVNVLDAKLYIINASTPADLNSGRPGAYLVAEGQGTNIKLHILYKDPSSGETDFGPLLEAPVQTLDLSGYFSEPITYFDFSAYMGLNYQRPCCYPEDSSLQKKVPFVAADENNGTVVVGILDLSLGAAASDIHQIHVGKAISSIDAAYREYGGNVLSFGSSPPPAAGLQAPKSGFQVGSSDPELPAVMFSTEDGDLYSGRKRSDGWSFKKLENPGGMEVLNVAFCPILEERSMIQLGKPKSQGGGGGGKTSIDVCTPGNCPSIDPPGTWCSVRMLGCDRAFSLFPSTGCSFDPDFQDICDVSAGIGQTCGGVSGRRIGCEDPTHQGTSQNQEVSWAFDSQLCRGQGILSCTVAFFDCSGELLKTTTLSGVCDPLQQCQTPGDCDNFLLGKVSVPESICRNSNGKYSVPVRCLGDKCEVSVTGTKNGNIVPTTVSVPSAEKTGSFWSLQQGSYVFEISTSADKLTYLLADGGTLESSIAPCGILPVDQPEGCTPFPQKLKTVSWSKPIFSNQDDVPAFVASNLAVGTLSHVSVYGGTLDEDLNGTYVYGQKWFTIHPSFDLAVVKGQLTVGRETYDFSIPVYRSTIASLGDLEITFRESPTLEFKNSGTIHLVIKNPYGHPVYLAGVAPRLPAGVYLSYIDLGGQIDPGASLRMDVTALKTNEEGYGVIDLYGLKNLEDGCSSSNLERLARIHVSLGAPNLCESRDIPPEDQPRITLDAYGPAIDGVPFQRALEILNSRRLFGTNFKDFYRSLKAVKKDSSAPKGDGMVFLLMDGSLKEVCH